MAGAEPEIFIGELLLAIPGRSEADGRRVAEEVARQLSELPPLPNEPIKIAKLSVNARVREGAGHQEIAEAIARAVHGALARRASSASTWEPASGARPAGAERQVALAEVTVPAEAPAPPADAPSGPTVRELDEGVRVIEVKPPPASKPPTKARHPKKKQVAPAVVPRPVIAPEEIPPASELVQGLLSGELTPPELTDLFAHLLPTDAEAKAFELLGALDAEVALIPPGPLPPLVAPARRAALSVLTGARNRQAQEEVERLTPFLRQGIIDGMPRHQVTAKAWSSIKALLLAQFGTMEQAEVYYNTNIGTGDAFGREGIKAHRALLAALKKAGEKFKRDLGPDARVDVTIGGLVVRTIEGTHRLSLHAGGLAVDVSSPTNPMFKDARFKNLKAAARIVTGGEGSLETFARLSTGSRDAEASGEASGDLLQAAKDLIEVTNRIEEVLSSDAKLEAEIVRILRDAGSDTPNEALASVASQLVKTKAVRLPPAVGDVLDRNLVGRDSPHLKEDLIALITLRHQAPGGKAFFVLSLPAEFIVALMSPDGGDLKWLGAAHDRKDFMHFEVKNGRSLIKP